MIDRPNLIGIDMGGTSFDVSLVVDGKPDTSEAVLEGLSMLMSVVNIHTVGAGGGRSRGPRPVACGWARVLRAWRHRTDRHLCEPSLDTSLAGAAVEGLARRFVLAPARSWSTTPVAGSVTVSNGISHGRHAMCATASCRSRRLRRTTVWPWMRRRSKWT